MLILAHRNQDVNQINLEVREKLINSGDIHEGFKINTQNGEINLSHGERILLLANDKSLNINNGQLGTVKCINTNESGEVIHFEVQLDNLKTITINPKQYNHFTYGYAATIHKAQGVTVDKSLIYIDGRGWDRHLTYVALSRHRKDCQVYVNQDTYSDFQALTQKLSRKRLKDNVLNYPINFAKRRSLNLKSIASKITQHLTDKLKSIRNKLINQQSKCLGQNQENHLDAFLEKYINMELEQTRLTNEMYAAKKLAPTESQQASLIAREHYKKLQEFIKELANHSEIQNLSFDKSIMLSKCGGFNAIANRFNSTLLTREDKQALVNHLRQSAIKLTSVRTQRQESRSRMR